MFIKVGNLVKKTRLERRLKFILRLMLVSLFRPLVGWLVRSHPGAISNLVFLITCSVCRYAIAPGLRSSGVPVEKRVRNISVLGQVP